MNIEAPAQLDIDAKIHNIENEIQLLKFHQETLEMEIGFIRPKLQSSIAVVKTMSEANELLNGFKTQWKEEDIPVRKQFFRAYDELSETVRRINSLQLQLDGFIKHRSQIEQSHTDRYSDQKLKDMIHQAVMLLKGLKNPQKEKMEMAIQQYQKGFINLESKISFYRALEVMLMQFK
jgi:chromosome segregation ATPase